MNRFWTFIGNDKYNIGCTGQTVYLLDKQNNEIAKFKDLSHAYEACISPSGNIFVIKTTEGQLAVYSFLPPALIKKFRYSIVDGSQDDNFCFSPDGKLFYNIERQIDSLKTVLSIYDTSDFSLKRRILDKNYLCVLSGIEYDTKTETVFLLGFFRNNEGVANNYFVCKLNNEELDAIMSISESEHDFYENFLHLKMSGFTDKTYQFLNCEIKLEKLKKGDYSLSKLWNKQCNNKN